jgi:hypothetical protein
MGRIFVREGFEQRYDAGRDHASESGCGVRWEGAERRFACGSVTRAYTRTHA